MSGTRSAKREGEERERGRECDQYVGKTERERERLLLLLLPHIGSLPLFRAPGHSLPRLGARLTSAGEILPLASCCYRRSCIDPRTSDCVSPLLTSLLYFSSSSSSSTNCRRRLSLSLCPVFGYTTTTTTASVCVWWTLGSDRWWTNRFDEEAASYQSRLLLLFSFFGCATAAASVLFFACVSTGAWRCKEGRAEEGQRRTPSAAAARVCGRECCVMCRRCQ